MRDVLTALAKLWKIDDAAKGYDEELRTLPAKIEAILLRGAAKARAIATPFMAGVRHAVGLRNLGSADTGKKAKADAKAALPSFKQYREKDGRFAFKLVDPKGRLLLQSQGFASPKDAGAAIARLQQVGATALPAFEGQVAAADGVSQDEIAAALQQLADAA